MRLTILGGGGFRVPLVYGALLRDHATPRVDDVVLYDTDAGRLATVAAVLAQVAGGIDDAPSVRVSTDLDDAVRGADFVFSAIRVGGLRGRTVDERVALDNGVLGQETTGPGGIAYGLRTIPVAVRIARRVDELAPQAWVINFTNPASMVTEAMRQVLGDRVVGICDSPIGLARRAGQALGYALDELRIDYAGLNHLGWLQGLRRDGADLLPGLLSDAQRVESFEEGRLFGADWIADLAVIPNEYLYYYYFTREAIARLRGGAQTRGEFLLHQQSAFFAEAERDREHAWRLWRSTRREREATYLAEARSPGESRDESDLTGGGYEGVALALMAALSGNSGDERLILNVRNGSTLTGLPPDAVIEVPCTVDRSGPRPVSLAPLRGHQLGLVQQVKAVEQLTIDAALTGSRRTAVKAFALHPLVDSVTTARTLYDGYHAGIPEFAAVFD